MLYYDLYMSSIERKIATWLSRSTFVDKVTSFLVLETFKDSSDNEAGPANLGMFAVFNALHSGNEDVGDEIEGFVIISPVSKQSEQSLGTQIPNDDSESSD